MGEYPAHCRQKEIKITTEYENNVPQITADFAKVMGVVDNLLSNAVKFTPMDGRINVRQGISFLLRTDQRQLLLVVQKKRKSPGYIYVSVEDSGIGIKRRIQNRIFDVFEQAASSYTKEEYLGHWP